MKKRKIQLHSIWGFSPSRLLTAPRIRQAIRKQLRMEKYRKPTTTPAKQV